MDEPTNPQQKIPEDIFADTDASRAQKSGNAPIPSTSQRPNPSIPRGRKPSGNKTMRLMIGAIVLIILGGGAYFVYTLSMSGSSDSGNTQDSSNEATLDTNESDEQDTQDNDKAGQEEVILDSDFDGLSDEREVELGLDINNSDSDSDNLSDRDEVDIYFTDPLDPDTDGDGFLDGNEVRQGFDPKGSGTLFVIPQ